MRLKLNCGYIVCKYRVQGIENSTGQFKSNVLTNGRSRQRQREQLSSQNNIMEQMPC